MKSKLSIWLVKVGEVLPFLQGGGRMRNYMLAEKLTERGHSVVYWTSGFDHSTKQRVHGEEEISYKNGFKIKILNGIGYEKNFSYKRYRDHKIIAGKFLKYAEGMQKPDVIVVATPPDNIAYAVLKFAREYDIPLIVDIRDMWPDTFLNQVPGIIRLPFRVLLSNQFINIKEIMRGADSLVAIADSLLEWGLNKANRKKRDTDRIFYIGANNGGVIESRRLDGLLDSGKFIVTYVGTFGHNSDPSIIIEAAKKLKGGFQFILVGDGELKKYVEMKASGVGNVVFTGWLSEGELNYVLEKSDCGICPTGKKESMFPNKVFAYLSAGLPVISSYGGDLKKVLESHNAGEYYAYDDVNMLVDCLQSLSDKVLRERMARNSKKLFDTRFDADRIYSEYAEHVENMVK